MGDFVGINPSGLSLTMPRSVQAYQQSAPAPNLGMQAGINTASIISTLLGGPVAGGLIQLGGTLLSGWLQNNEVDIANDREERRFMLDKQERTKADRINRADNWERESYRRKQDQFNKGLTVLNQNQALLSTVANAFKRRGM